MSPNPFAVDDLSQVRPISVEDLRKAYGKEQILQLDNCRRWLADPYAFLTEGCYTKDEVAAGTIGKDVVRLIPKKEYLAYVVRKWGEEDRLALPKSRRMLMTWVLTALELRLCLYFPVTIHIYAQKQTAADGFVARHKFIYEHLPASLPKPQMKEWKGVEGDPSKLLFVQTGAEIEAFPGNPDAVRGEGCSVARLEEFAFWQWPEHSWKAILPTVMGGGKLVVVSTPLANTLFKSLVFDEMGRVS